MTKRLAGFMSLASVVVLGCALAAAEPASAELTRQLDAKVDVSFRRSFPNEVLSHLARIAGLNAACPLALGNSYFFSLEANQATVREVLEKLAAAGQCELEISGDTVALWKANDPEQFKAIEKELEFGGTQARCEAVADLRYFTDKKIFPLLLQVLNDEDLTVRCWALQTLKTHLKLLNAGYSPEQRQTLANTLANWMKTWPVAARGSLISVLGALKFAEIPPSILALASDDNFQARADAARAIAQSQAPHAEKILLELLSDPWQPVSMAAAEALGQRRCEAAVDRLIELAERNSTKGLYQNGYKNALMQIGTGRAAEAAIRLNTAGMFSSYPNMLHQPAVFDKLVAGCQKGYSLAAQAVADLGYIGNPRAVEILLKLLAQPITPQLKNNVVSALATIQVPEARDAVIRYFQEKPLASDLNWTPLGQTRDPRAVELLLKACEVKQTNYRGFGSPDSALADTRDPRAFEYLRQKKLDANGIMNSTYQTLINAGDNQALELLQQKLAPGNPPDQRFNAAQALANLPRLDVREKIFAVLADPDAQVRQQFQYYWNFSDPRLAMIREDNNANGYNLRYQMEQSLREGNLGSFERQKTAMLQRDPLFRPWITALQGVDSSQAFSELLRHLKTLTDPARPPEPNNIGISRDEVDRAVTNALAQSTAGCKELAAIVNDAAAPMPARKACAQALGKTGSRAVLPEVVGLLEKLSSELKLDMLAGLSQVEEPRIVPALLALLADKDEKMRAQAVRQVASRGIEKELLPLQDDPSAAVRSMLASALSQTSVNALPIAVKLAGDPDASVRMSVVQKLAYYFPAPEAEKAFMPLTQDPDANVRKLALSSLSWSTHPKKVDLLLAALKRETNADVKQVLVQNLGQTVDERVLDALLELLKEPGPDLKRTYIIQALRQFQNPRMIDALVPLFDSTTEEWLGWQAMSALQWSRDPRVINGLLKALEDPNNKHRTYVAQMLRGMNLDELPVKTALEKFDKDAAKINQQPAQPPPPPKPAAEPAGDF